MTNTATSENTRESWTGFTVTLCLLSILGFVVNLLASFIFMMATEGCRDGSGRFLCTGAGAATVPLLPWLGWGTAIAVSIRVSSQAVRRGGSTWTGLPFGFAIYAPVLLVGYSFATR